jgi:hypothetical protein
MGKRYVKLQAASILAWFQKGWDVARNTEVDLREWVETECQGSVYGLSSIFDQAREKELPKPGTWQELHELLLEHLYVEGDSDFIQQDEFSLRVRTDDDENELAYYFFEDDFAAAHPEIVAYLLLETHDLAALPPEDVMDFAPAGRLTEIAPPGQGEGGLYLCFIGRGLPKREGPFHIKGIRLPDFNGYLRTASGNDLLAKWPRDLRYIRAFTGEMDENPREALRLCGSSFKEFYYPAEGIGTIGEARAEIEREVAISRTEDRTRYSSNADDPFVAGTEHFVQLCASEGASGNPAAIRMILSRSEETGLKGRLPDFIQADQYKQWFIFDDLWAGKHPRLAASILRFCSHWDPLVS